MGWNREHLTKLYYSTIKANYFMDTSYFYTENVNSNKEVIYIFSIWTSSPISILTFIWLYSYLCLKQLQAPRLFHSKSKPRDLTCDHIMEHKLLPGIVKTSAKSSLVFTASLTAIHTFENKTQKYCGWKRVDIFFTARLSWQKVN